MEHGVSASSASSTQSMPNDNNRNASYLAALNGVNVPALNTPSHPPKHFVLSAASMTTKVTMTTRNTAARFLAIENGASRVARTRRAKHTTNPHATPANAFPCTIATATQLITVAPTSPRPHSPIRTPTVATPYVQNAPSIHSIIRTPPTSNDDASSTV